MGETLVIDRKIVDAIETKRKLIELQDYKRQLIAELTEDNKYMYELLKHPDNTKRVTDAITAIETSIKTQHKKIAQTRNAGMDVSKTINIALYNELVVCKEILTTRNDAPRLIEKLDELRKKIIKTMIELRATELKIL